MNQNDNRNDPFAPFDDNDRTVIRPMPGGRRSSSAAPVVDIPAFNPQPAPSFAAPVNPSASMAFPTVTFQ